MVRPLLHAPLRFRRIIVPTGPGLYRRNPTHQSINAVNAAGQRLFTLSHRCNQGGPNSIEKEITVGSGEGKCNAEPDAKAPSGNNEPSIFAGEERHTTGPDGESTPGELEINASSSEEKISSTPKHKDASSAAPKASPGRPAVVLDEQKLVLKLPSKDLAISYIQLRDSCKCTLCVDVHSKQRNYRLSDIPPHIKAKSLEWEKDVLKVTWDDDIPGFDSSHASRYTLQQLEFPHPYPVTSATGIGRKRIPWNKNRMTKLQHWISYDDYMHNDEKFTSAMRSLATMGLIFLKDIPDSREMVEKIATRIGPLRNTFYGPSWDVRKVPEAKNVAYTSQYLGFHMDLMYMKDPPAFQLLHCIRNSCDGGESLFADAFSVAKYLYRNRPDIFKILTQTKLRYEYRHKDHNYSNTWPVFEKDPIDKGRLPARVAYSPPFQAPILDDSNAHTKYITKVQSELRALKYFARSLEKEENMFELKLQPGECVIFENRRIVHARRQFNTATGERWLAGAYLDEDVVASRFRVLQESHQDAWLNFLDMPLSQKIKQIKGDPEAVARDSDAWRGRSEDLSFLWTRNRSAARTTQEASPAHGVQAGQKP
ncbi:hypothetical protein BDV10DRAFT_171457 [Aspergillus recurvatus]